MHSTTVLATLLANSVAGASTLDAQNATTFALLFGYPLLSWQEYFANLVEDVGGANIWRHNRQFSSADQKAVVEPNVDTLYSTFAYDLTEHDLAITIPYVPVEDLKLFGFWDPYGVNYAIIGTDGFYEPGTYLLRTCQTCNETTGAGISNATSPDYAGFIDAPGPYGTVLIRWGVSPDLNTVHQRQNATLISPVPRSNTSSTIADQNLLPLTQLINIYNTSTSPAVNVLNMLAYFAPPGAPSETFKAAGVDVAQHSYTPVDSVDLEKANTTAIRQIQEAFLGTKDNIAMNNNWTQPSPSEMGVYGTDYAFRAAVAVNLYIGLRNPYAIYPVHHNTTAESHDAELQLMMGANEAIMFTFSGRPPVTGPAGFWSLTAYGGGYFLIPNDRDVYSLGDRSNLTFPSGELVYPSGHATNGTLADDGPFQILLQPADVAPPANWTSNWLPAPSGGGAVVPQLRFYVAREGLFDGSYNYPIVEKVDAIVGVPASTGGAALKRGAVGGAASLAATLVAAAVGL